MNRCLRATARVLLIAIALMLVMASPADAADTGSLAGAVFNANGEPVAGAAVKLSGEQLPVSRTTDTGESGAFRFDYLLPGDYTVEVVASGAVAIRRTATVALGRETQLDFVVGMALTEQVTVVAVVPTVDTRSSEVSFNYTAETFNALPLERSYKGLFQLLPGVAENRSNIGPAAGGDRQGNTYLMDGANITNPGFGYLSTEVNELDIAEVNLKRGGISAEFGRTAGSVTNVVSRSGTNRLTSLARLDWLPQGLVAGYALPENLVAAGVRPGTFRDPLLSSELSPAIGIGGPLLRDRAFFYGSARYSRGEKWERFNKVGTALPDEIRISKEFYGKLTAIPSSSHQLNVGFRFRPHHVDNALLDANTAPSVGSNTTNNSRIGSAEWTNFLTARSSLNVRYLYMRELNEDRPTVDLGYLPPFQPANLVAMGQFNDPSQADLRVGANQFTNIQNYRRHEVRGVYSRFFDAVSASHSFKAGAGLEFGEEELNRITNGWGAIVTQTVNGVPALRTRYFTTQPAQLGQGHTYSTFAQDNVTIGTRLAMNLGVLLNSDSFGQTLDGSGGCPANVLLTGGAAVYESNGDTCTFMRFGFLDEVQPRLGVSYQLRRDASDKAYANWGRYYNMDQKSAGRSLAPARIFQTQTFFDLSGAVLSSGPLASTTGKLIDPDVKPTYTDELVLGYATPFKEKYSLDIFYMFRTMKNFIEDVPSRINGSAQDAGPYAAANLPCTRFASCQNANATRTYRSVTLDLRRRFTDGIMGDVSYTWSRFEGNFDIDFAQVAVFNTSSFIQDAPGTYVEDPNRFGPLMEDRPHVLKAFVTYAPTGRLSTSGYLRVQSGAPWAARGRDWPGGTLNYLEPAGSHRNPAWTNLDLMATYRLPIDGRARMSIEGRLLNVFNNQTQLSTDVQQYLDLRTIPTPPFFAPYQQPNPFFATGNAFSPPRRLHLALLFNW